MPITLDPQKQFVTISHLYVEISSSEGDDQVRFIADKEGLEEWKSRGYRYEDEVKGLLATQKTDKNGPLPGVPISEQSSFDPKKIIYSIRTKWKKMTWKDHNIIFSKCVKTIPGIDGTLRSELDTINYRDMKLKICLKEWDLKNGEGKDVAVSNDSIDSLSPDVATELINAFEKYTEASSDDLGESKG